VLLLKIVHVSINSRFEVEGYEYGAIPCCTDCPEVENPPQRSKKQQRKSSEEGFEEVGELSEPKKS
jgi:hypothetical protein